jgi:hypothetical protein
LVPRNKKTVTCGAEQMTAYKRRTIGAVTARLIESYTTQTNEQVFCTKKF